MKLSWLKTVFIAASITIALSALTEVSPVNDVVAAPGGGGGMGPVCPPACPPNPANCDGSLVIAETQGLNFGSFSLPTGGGGGQVIVDPNGVRTTNNPAGVVLISGGGERAGTFSMSTTPYNCTGRALVTVTANSPGGLGGMALDTFVLIPGPGDAFDPAVPLQVGATLHTTGAEAPGSYSGTYTVTVTFQ